MATEAVMDDLLTRTKRLRAAARTKRDNQRDQQAQGQVATALSTLRGNLTELGAALALRARLIEAGIPVSEIPDLSKPALALRDHVRDVGRPTGQFLSARSRDVARLRDDARSANGRAWEAWATAALEEVSLDELPAFGERANGVRERMRMLWGWARDAPSGANITQFKLTLQFVHEDIAAILDRSDPEDLWTRISGGRVTLADLSNAELAELRSNADVASKIQLRLRD